VLYTEECPKHDPATLLDLDVNVAEMCLVFDYELVFRVVDYFFDKILWSLSASEPYEDPSAVDLSEK